MLGYAEDYNSYHIKVQRNFSDGDFNLVGFYRCNNASGGAGSLLSLDSPSAQAHFTMSYTGTVATLTIDPVGGAQQVYTHDYGFSPTGTLNGIGLYGPASIDNFLGGPAVATGAVPEPATWGMMILGFGAVGYAMRRRQNNATKICFAA